MMLLSEGADERLQGRGADAARLAQQGQGASRRQGLRRRLAARRARKARDRRRIPSKSNRKVAIPYDAVLYKQRHRIENTFGRLKDWRRIHTRDHRCAHTYFSAICIAAAVIFWL